MIVGQCSEAYGNRARAVNMDQFDTMKKGAPVLF